MNGMKTNPYWVILLAIFVVPTGLYERDENFELTLIFFKLFSVVPTGRYERDENELDRSALKQMQSCTDRT